MDVLSVDARPNGLFETKRSSKRIEIKGFTSYNIALEGTNLSANDRTPRSLSLELGMDGSLTIVMEKTGESEDKTTIERLFAQLPRGYEFYHQTEAAKVIRGVRGAYYHFRHPATNFFVSFSVAAGTKPTRIVLGSLTEPDSKLRSVLDAALETPFRKAELVHVLPQNIVENRQPIKAALDILVKEGYIAKVEGKGSVEQFVRTNKKAPEVVGRIRF